MNKQADPTNWAELIDDFQASGQSMAAWCRTKNLKPYQLAYWSYPGLVGTTMLGFQADTLIFN
jgi:hypothetical protein